MKNKNLSGSALIIVLGMLSVLMLMSIAFSTFMRTERGATTNLRNSHVAEQALQTALSLAIQSIEDSFSELKDGYSNAVVDSPVAVWPQPWLASCGPADLARPNIDPYFHSARRMGQDALPQVLCAEEAEFLSSNQIAMIKAAEVGWAPIYSGIGVSNIYGEAEANYGRNAGYPATDGIVGRYAFVALDTTGGLDIGKVGFDGNESNAAADRARGNGGNARFFVPVESEASDADGKVIDSPVVNRANLAKAAETAGSFSSYKDLKLAKNSGVYMRAPTSADVKTATYMPPDLYSGCTVSLEELTPEGDPKVKIPTLSEYSGYSKAELIAFEKRVFPAMMAVFAHSRMDGGLENWYKKPEGISLYPFRKAANTTIPKSALATVALMDAVDGDGVSGKSSARGVSYWNELKNMGQTTVVIDGEDVTDETTGTTAAFSDPLNFPCTESAPLLSMLYAYITIDTANPGEKKYDRNRTGDGSYAVPAASGTRNPLDCGWYREYNAQVHIGAKAVCMNQGRVSNPRRNVKMKVEYDFLAETPPGSSSPCNAAGSMEDGNVKASIDYSGDSEYWRILWQTLFDGESHSFTVNADGDINDLSMNPDERGLVSTGFFEDGGQTLDFKIVCGLDRVNTPGEYDESGACTTEPTGMQWHPITKQAYLQAGGDSSALTDIWIPVRFKVTISDSSSSGDAVQQVPAPVLDTDSKEWWVRVDMGAYHASGASSHTHGGNTWTLPGGFNANGSEGDLAAGWAICLAPQFGMDTSSLATYADNEPAWPSVPIKFWLNNVVAHAGAAGNGTEWDNASSAFRESAISLLDISDPERGGLSGAFDGDGYLAAPSPLYNWLFRKDVAEDRWFNWFIASSDTTERPSPDFLHTFEADSSVPFFKWYKESQYETRLDSELRTWIPTDGVKSMTDLGALMIGPFETLSLFKTWRLSDYVNPKFDPDSDFHPVMDYFTMSEDRYPASSDIVSYISANGEIEWDSLGKSGSENRPLFSAAHSGRVNLNLPRLLKRYPDNDANKYPRVNVSRHLNPYPLAAALNKAPFLAVRVSGNDRSIVTNALSDDIAIAMASKYAAMLENVGDHPAEADFYGSTVTTHITNIVENAADNLDENSDGDIRLHRPIVRNLSFFASAFGETENSVLRAFLDGLTDTEKRYSCDYMRESVLRGVSESFTTRGQSFLVALRADAYTSRFGMEEDPSGGQTLASTHALVELFRDPEPARLPDGTFPLDSDGNPVLYHNWFIRSFRMF